jgi:hypothetical protein
MNQTLHRFEVEELWMTDFRKTHPAEEVVERFALGRLDEPELGFFEEHLLQCDHCQERLDETTAYIGIMREAAGRVAAVEALAPAETSAWRRFLLLDWLRIPSPGLSAAGFRTPVLSGAMALFLAIAVWQPWRTAAPADWRDVDLVTMRGAADGGQTVEGFALHLRLDVSGLDLTGVTAQLVTANGSSLAELPVAIVAGKGDLRYSAGLSAGQYWVRLKRAGETLREYSLNVTRP